MNSGVYRKHLTVIPTQVITKMGDPLEKFYFVEEGEVSLSQRSVSSSFKLTKSKVRLVTGDFFGETIFFESTPTADAVVAVSEDVFVITISKEM